RRSWRDPSRSLLAVERGVDLGRLLGLAGLARSALAVPFQLAAEGHVEVAEREPAAVADLLERLEQLLAVVCLLGHLLGGTDLDRPVALEPGRRRDQLPDDDVLLQAHQPVDLA